MPLLKTIVFYAAALAALAFAAPSQGQSDGTIEVEVTPEERSAVIEQSLVKLKTMYIFPEVAEKMAAAVRERAAGGEYDAIRSGNALARKLTADLREVSHDKHLGVTFFPEGAREPSPGGPSKEEIEAQRPMMERLNFGFEKVERLQGNVGYMEIRGFVPPVLGADTATAAMTFLAHCDALIVDLRRNGGGEPAMIAYLLSYLFDGPTHLNDIYEREGATTRQWWTMPSVPGRRYGGKKPVYVLISRRTFSGAEEFAYNLKHLKRATLIGETTGGGAHPSRPVKVSEHFMIEVPYARAINPITRTNWEGTGVSPDIEKPTAEALDAAIRMALEKLMETADSPHQKAQLEKLIGELNKSGG